MQIIMGIILGGAAAFMFVLIWSICAVASEMEEMERKEKR